MTSVRSLEKRSNSRAAVVEAAPLAQSTKDTQATQGGVYSALQVVDVVLAGLGGHIAHLANIATCFHRDIVVAKEDNILDFFLQFIGQLEALAVEDLDAIVLEGVVTAEMTMPASAPSSTVTQATAGGGQGAQVQHVGPRGAQPPR